MSLLGLIENLLGEILFWAFIVLLGVYILYYTKRGKLLSFFGMGKWRRAKIYLSNIHVKPFGSSGIDGTQRSYTGEAVPFGESRAAEIFIKRLGSLFPLLADTPGVLGKIGIKDLYTEIIPSPANGDHLEDGCTIISLGSPAYNLISDLITNKFPIKTRFPLNDGIVINGYPDTIQDASVGIIERIHDNDGKRSIFYVAGLSEFSTVRAAKFLITNWYSLYQRFNDNCNFIIVIRFNVLDESIGEELYVQKY